MRAFTLTKTIALILSIVWMVGCSSNPKLSDSDSSTTGNNTGVDTSNSIDASSIRDIAGLKTVFYFDFDQSTIKQEGLADLERHAAYLASHPSARVMLEGNTDERGTREYNMALGERRAEAVGRFLQINGVQPMQIETVSLGEERPAAFGHTESSWSQNRRVVIKYMSR